MNTVHSVDTTRGEPLIVDIQTHSAKSLPGIQLIGVVGKSLDESKERIRSAFSSSSIELPRKKLTVNLVPSDIPKNGSQHDLGIALSILLTAGQIPVLPEKCIVLGELGLDGEVKPVRGILGKILYAKKQGYTKFIIPAGNSAQARLIPSVELFVTESLTSLHKQLTTNKLLFIDTADGNYHSDVQTEAQIDFQEVIGQQAAKRALEIAAAGHHNVLLSGPPGVGKSMLAKALIGILPPLSREEIITVTHLHSLAEAEPTSLITKRPLRAPHHSASDVAIIGGGQRPKPGEVTLSHHGVLFLDELPEFKRSTLESLRQPLEDHSVTVSRAQERSTYPARFMLIATKNPCPCGFLGSTKPCICAPIEIDRYQKKLSGPLLDRIDIHVTVDSVDHTALLEKDTATTHPTEQSASVKKRVENARMRQKNRLQSPGSLNGFMTNRHIKQHTVLDPQAKELLDTAAKKLDLSARVYMKTVKVAQTIADLDESSTIKKEHIAEALRYRPVTA